MKFILKELVENKIVKPKIEFKILLNLFNFLIVRL